MIDEATKILPFLLGIVIYAVTWAMLFRKPGFGSMLSTLEHEITHSVFALLTLHPVTSLKTSWNKGGHMTFRGEGNWLIFIAPYFFPTLSVVVMLVTLGLDPEALGWASGALGATVSYHATSTWRETHRQQTDLQMVGFPFAACFLPTANVVSFGLILSMARGGGAASSEFLSTLWRHSSEFSAVITSAAG